MVPYYGERHSLFRRARRERCDAAILLCPVPTRLDLLSSSAHRFRERLGHTFDAKAYPGSKTMMLNALEAKAEALLKKPRKLRPVRGACGHLLSQKGAW